MKIIERYKKPTPKFFRVLRNIGIALFAKDSFFKNIIVASSDEIDIPSTTKTFEVRVIGEIDSTIKWITTTDLGSINANFTSNLKLVAETTVPDNSSIENKNALLTRLISLKLFIVTRIDFKFNNY